MEDIRTALVTVLETLKTSYATDTKLVVEYDNGLTVDHAVQAKPYLQVNIQFMDGYQADLGDSPTHRVLGQLVLIAWVKAGTGSKTAYGLVEHFYKGMQHRQIGSVRLKVGIPTKQAKLDDWIGFPVLLPFWSDSTI